MTIPTEPIGSIPRPLALIEAVASRGPMAPALDSLLDEAIRDTIARVEAFCDDTSTTRETAFAKLRARVLGTALASASLGGD